MLDMTKRGDILGFTTQYVVINGTIAVDQAIRAIEKKPMMTFVKPIPDMVTRVCRRSTWTSLSLRLTSSPSSPSSNSARCVGRRHERVGIN